MNYVFPDTMFVLKSNRGSAFEVDDVGDVPELKVVWGTWVDSGVWTSCLVDDLLDPDGLIPQAVKEMET
ncbi:MAG: hypothetical protein V3U60_16120 [Gammaproteobacteria bacterium]